MGYMVAGLSIIGSAKSQVGAVMFIPILALGVPLFDTILSPLRRFVRGKKTFSPDMDHIHHRLLKIGFSPKNAVLLIYTITLFLCATAVVLINIRDERAGLFIIVLGAGAILFFRKLGYTDQITSSLISDWVEDLSDDMSFFGRDHRSFVGLLNSIVRSKNIKELWQNVVVALETLELDKGSLYLNAPIKIEKFTVQMRATSETKQTDRRETLPIESSVIMRKSPPELDWVRPPFEMEDYVCSRSILRLELPLLDKENAHLGTLVLVKDVGMKPLNHQTLRRVEDLRRIIIRKLEMMADESVPQKHAANK